MCKSFGRQEDIEENQKEQRKRKQTKNNKFSIGPPWQSDYFLSHLKSQHSIKWTKYQKLSQENKDNFFFIKISDEVVNMHLFVRATGNAKSQFIAKEKLEYYINKDIIEDIIGNILFDTGNSDNDKKLTIEKRKNKHLRFLFYKKMDKSTNPRHNVN